MAITIQKARIRQVKEIQALIKLAASEGAMLPRALSDLYEYLRDFYVACDTRSGEIVGCCALHVCWDNLAEVRSLAVKPSLQGKGIGRRLVQKCIAEARALEIGSVFALTYVPAFFAKLGFSDYPKEKLPHKVWSDCIHCHKFPDCDEIAVALDLAVDAR